MGAVAAITEPRTARFGAMVRIREQGQDQGAEGHAGLRLERKKNHLWAASALAVVKAVRCVSNRTRPVSWLGPATSGVHPHTKGARCFAGGQRHGLPSAQGASSRLAWRQAATHRVQSMHSSGSITRKFGPSRKAATGHMLTQSVHLQRMQASVTTWVMAAPPRTGPPARKRARAPRSAHGRSAPARPAPRRFPAAPRRTAA